MKRWLVVLGVAVVLAFAAAALDPGLNVPIASPLVCKIKGDRWVAHQEGSSCLPGPDCDAFERAPEDSLTRHLLEDDCG